MIEIKKTAPITTAAAPRPTVIKGDKGDRGLPGKDAQPRAPVAYRFTVFREEGGDRLITELIAEPI